MYSNTSKPKLLYKAKQIGLIYLLDPLMDRSSNVTPKNISIEKNKEHNSRRPNHQFLAPGSSINKSDSSSKQLRTPSNNHLKMRATKTNTPTSSQSYNNSTKYLTLSKTPSYGQNVLNKAVFSSLRNSCNQIPFL
jgi:hypothetical protein